jgi:hypothetical protein
VIFGLALVGERLRRRARVSAPQADVADASCARVAHHLRGKLQLHPGSPRGASSCPTSAARAVHPQGLPLQDASRRLPRLHRRLLARCGPMPITTCCLRLQSEASRSHAPLSSRMCPLRPAAILAPAAARRPVTQWLEGRGGQDLFDMSGATKSFCATIAFPIFFSKFIQSSLMARDGNGDPIPDSPRGIHLLGDGDGTNLIPMGNQTGEIASPSGMAGTGMYGCPPSPFPRNPLALQVRAHSRTEFYSGP